MEEYDFPPPLDIISAHFKHIVQITRTVKTTRYRVISEYYKRRIASFLRQRIQGDAALKFNLLRSSSWEPLLLWLVTKGRIQRCPVRPRV